MELVTMGRVVVSAKVENLEDLFAARRGVLGLESVKRVEIDNALVDTGATMLSLPKSLISRLGLQRTRVKRAKTPAGVFEFGIYEAVRLTVQDRDCIIEVAEVADECPPLIGQVPLEMLDFVVDLKGQRLIGNPEHGGEQMFEMY